MGLHKMAMNHKNLILSFLSPLKKVNVWDLHNPWNRNEIDIEDDCHTFADIEMELDEEELEGNELVIKKCNL